MNLKPKAISVLSGGLDSTVATAYYKDQYQLHAVTFNYGQRSAEMEIKSSREICEFMGMEHTIIELPWLAAIGNSALTNHQEVPQLGMDQLDDKKLCDQTARRVWVPGRNIVFTAIATSFAEAEGASAIIVGWDQEEAVTFPDNSREFLDAFNKVLEVGSLDEIKIKAPLINLNKTEIVELGYEVETPLHLTYSCYMGDEEHCGICESCMRRKRAFYKSGIEDRTRYRDENHRK
jgi:7-cyano-7-deazaguanine synthase